MINPTEVVWFGGEPEEYCYEEEEEDDRLRRRITSGADGGVITTETIDDDDADDDGTDDDPKPTEYSCRRVSYSITARSNKHRANESPRIRARIRVANKLP